MQPILAESAPHRRSLVVAAALAVAALIATTAVALPRPHHRWHRHHHLPYNGQCPYGYVYVSR
jgi:hypothetical protein